MLGTATVWCVCMLLVICNLIDTFDGRRGERPKTMGWLNDAFSWWQPLSPLLTVYYDQQYCLQAQRYLWPLYQKIMSDVAEGNFPQNQTDFNNAIKIC